MNTPRIGIYGLTGCAGDQLTILNCEDRLLEIASRVVIVDFPMASTARDRESRLDIAFVDGAVMSEADESLLRWIRDRSETLVAMGTCAVWGGIPDVGAAGAWPEMVRARYGAESRYDARSAAPLGAFVRVDVSLPGCPIEIEEFLDCLECLSLGRRPLLPRYPVCAECRWRENGCLLTDRRAACLGPLTAGGCHARCPTRGQPCIGCRGPVEDPNVPSLVRTLVECGVPESVARAKVGAFLPCAPAAGGNGGPR